jgi:hypothetical protein
LHQTYRTLILSRVVSAFNDAQALGGISHDGLKGHLREIVIRDLLRPLMPADTGLGTGEIIAANGRTSKQQDVVIFDRAILPPILMESAGIFPVESALYAMEVKSRLDRAGLEQAHHSATDLSTFQYTAGTYDEHDRPVDHSVQKVRYALVAFGTEIANVPATYDEIRGSDDPACGVICVVGSGYWYFDSRLNSWVTWNVTFGFEETVAFLSGVMNTIPAVRESRRNPRLGNYLL